MDPDVFLLYIMQYKYKYNKLYNKSTKKRSKWNSGFKHLNTSWSTVNMSTGPT